MNTNADGCNKNASTLHFTNCTLSTVVSTVKSCSAFLRITLLPNGTLKIANVTRRDAASYTCIAKNQFGTASTTGRLLITGESRTLLHQQLPLNWPITAWTLSLFVNVMPVKLSIYAQTASMQFTIRTKSDLPLYHLSTDASFEAMGS